jgi:hypothetical protein
VALGVNDVVAPPFPDVSSLEHASLLPAAPQLLSQIQAYPGGWQQE